MTSCGISKLFKHVKCLNHIQDVWNTKHEPYFTPIWHECLFDCNADASLLILLKGKQVNWSLLCKWSWIDQFRRLLKLEFFWGYLLLKCGLNSCAQIRAQHTTWCTNFKDHTKLVNVQLWINSLNTHRDTRQTSQKGKKWTVVVTLAQSLVCQVHFSLKVINKDTHKCLHWTAQLSTTQCS